MTAGLILAAGRGIRFGGRKMLAIVEGMPMLQHVLNLAAAVELDPVIVILGDDAGEIEAVMTWRNETRLRNENPSRGLSSSVALGLAALGDSDSVLILLGDQPFASLENARSIMSVPRDRQRPIVVPRYESGEPGNPVLLEHEAYALAANLHGDRGMSQLFAAHPELVRYVAMSGVNADIDTPADLARVIPSAE